MRPPRSIPFRRAVVAALLASLAAGPTSGPAAAQERAADAEASAVEPDADLRTLRRTLSELLGDPALRRAHVGLAVQAAGSGEILFQRAAERRFTAASTTKLVTGAVALHRLGADHRWRTRIVADGGLVEGTLHGDLWLVGGGDPVLERERIGQWARDIRAAGIRRVTGDLIGDDRVFEGAPWGRGWMWDDLFGGWGAGVSALQVWPASIPGELRPGPAPGEPASFRILEQGTRLPIEPRVRTGAPGSEVRLRFLPRPDGSDVVLDGWIPADRERVRLSLAPPHPTLYALDLARRALAAEGVELIGSARRPRDGEQPGPPAWERAFDSPPLADVLPRMLKPSDNQIAETLLRTIGLEADGTGSAEAGLETIEETLAGWGIEPGAASLADGSGLSRYDEVTPAALVRLLRRTSQLPGFRAFREALPVGARDGTLARRFLSTAGGGAVRAKTGSLSGVRGLAGFVQDGDGETLVFALLINGYDVPGEVATALEDLLVEQLALYHGPTYPRTRTRPGRGAAAHGGSGK